MTHPHAPPEATPQDGPFLRSFSLALLLLIAGVAGFTWLVDPLGRFGTGLLPPAISADRDQKATAYRALSAPPVSVVLGSSRSKTLAPACFSLHGAGPAFNFAVNGAVTDDLVAILRFLRATPRFTVQTFYLGLDPEMLQASGPVHRPLAQSRSLARFAPGGAPPTALSLVDDVLGWQVVETALRSVYARWGGPAALPETVLDADGLQRSPRIEAVRAAGRFDADLAVEGSLPGILGRYASFARLDPARVAALRQFLDAARGAGATVVAFQPPVHPRMREAAAATAWAARTAETTALLRDWEAGGLLRYVETADLADLPGSATAFVDGIHFLEPLSARVVERLLGAPARCALQ